MIAIAATLWAAAGLAFLILVCVVDAEDEAMDDARIRALFMEGDIRWPRLAQYVEWATWVLIGAAVLATGAAVWGW